MRRRYRKPKPSPKIGNEVFFRPSIQTKLTVGKPNDKFEVEADTMADKVVNAAEGQRTIRKMEGTEDDLQQKPLAASVTPFIQRKETAEEEPVQAKCDACEEDQAVQKTADEEPQDIQQLADTEEEPVQKMKDEEKDIQQKQEEESVQAKAIKQKPPNTPLEGKLKSNKGKGAKMDSSTKSIMEQGFGTDFNNVAIHTDSEAVQMSKELGAQAFTHGNDIYFNEGNYRPATKEGKHLLAHELTHTLQQNNNAVRKQENSVCNSSMITTARQNAFFRVQIVKHKLSGLHPTLGIRQQTDMMRLARKIVSPKIRSLRAVQQLIESMLNVLTSDNNIVCGPEIDNCSIWNAYVENNNSPIHLCNSFFNLSEEGQTRTLIHEAAHAAGIGSATSESYIMIFDCETGADDYTSADAWAHFINCASNQTPDQPGNL